MTAQLKHIAKHVDKSNVPYSEWPLDTVHRTYEEREDVLIKLRVATVLGNLEKIKCRLYFSDAQGLKFIETTVWAVCEGNVILKSGTWIPIRRILDVVI